MYVRVDGINETTSENAKCPTEDTDGGECPRKYI
jgi:hypothetical protein